MFDFITLVIYLQLSANFLTHSIAQPQQRSLFSEFHANYKNQHDNEEPTYSYHYYIDHPESMVHLHHREERHGKRLTGEYGLLEPGGSVRSVHYTVDGNGGFRAIIRSHTAASSVHQLFRLTMLQPTKPVQHARPVALII